MIPMKTLKKSISLLLAAVMMLTACRTFSFAAGDISVNVRIEGITSKLFYSNITVPSGSTVLDAVMKADAVSDKIKVTVTDGPYGAYVTAVNDEREGTFGGYDGWSYRVNGEEPDVSMDKFKVKTGSKIVLYYGDPYGEGMQYPVADTTMLAAGYLSFKSTDTVYNDDGTVSKVENVITDYILEWGVGGGATVDLYPDENGIITIDKEYLTKEEHSVQIIKTNDSGMPLVLRFAPDYTINVTRLDTDGTNNPAVNVIYQMRDFIMKIIEFIKELVFTFQHITDGI